MATYPTTASIVDTLSNQEGIDDMARRRLQRDGNLYEQGGWWKLRWREDVLDADGGRNRAWSKPAWIGPSEGAGKLTEKQARRIAWDNFLSNLDQNTRTPNSVVTLAEFVARRFEPEHVATLKDSGRIHYKTMLGQILPALGEMRLRDITTSDLQQFVSGLKARKLAPETGKQRTERIAAGEKYEPRYRTDDAAAPQTRLNVKNALSAIFEHAIAMEWHPGPNPARKIRLPEITHAPTHALTFEQVTALVRELKTPYAEMAYCAVMSSMNIAEVCGVRWQWLNTSADWVVSDGERIPPHTVFVREQWKFGKYVTLKTAHRRRLVPLTPGLEAMLTALRTRSKYTGPTDPIFASRTGTPVDAHNALTRHLKPAGKRLGMPWLGWHTLRRTTATAADEFGMSTAGRKGLLGHGTAAMATHYVQGDHEAARRVLENMEGKILQ